MHSLIIICALRYYRNGQNVIISLSDDCLRLINLRRPPDKVVMRPWPRAGCGEGSLQRFKSLPDPQVQQDKKTKRGQVAPRKEQHLLHIRAFY